MENREKKVIALASDHAGYHKKEVIRKFLDDKGIPYKDFGCFTDKSCDYSEFGHVIGKAVDEGAYETGISFCGTGQGISMTANKYQNVRSALCWNTEIATLARQHNDANICAIPARFVDDDEVVAIVATFLETGFEGGRHARRIAGIPIK